MVVRREVDKEKRQDEYAVTMAEQTDEPELRELLSGHDLAVYGNVEDYVVLKAKGSICAAAKLVPIDKNSYHLEVFGVKSGLQGKGVGGCLLSEIIKSPWKYSCSLGEGSEQRVYRITTVARGEAAGFYKRYGFQPYSFAALPPPYDKQCDECEDRVCCKPMPLVYEKKGR